MTFLSGVGFLLLVVVGSVLALAPGPKTWTPVPSKWRTMLARAAAPAVGLALFGSLWLIQPAVAIGAGLVGTVGWYLVTVLPTYREKKAVNEDILGLVVYMRMSLGRGAPPRQALHEFATNIRPGRPLAKRIEHFIQAVEIGWKFKRAFEQIVIGENRHLRRLSQMMQALERSHQPQTILQRFTERIVDELRQELRIKNRRQLMLGLVVTVLFMMAALLIALLEPTLWTMVQIFSDL